ncbi:hypothetical protein [Fulvivirga lutimaris]|uniref:hypothetical protein n=1 Tax=Fulvivirga lutimaris TaxID=1819566 RepID=UPI0012BCCF0A|nr:hypothetical protein [Fulvivirga lutimaris]MTI41207.1 hypothetical protein [Fulvivirga lutimaris]
MRNMNGRISCELCKDYAKFKWREVFTVGTFIAWALPLGLLVNEIMRLLGLSHKSVTLAVASVVILVALVIALLDYFNRIRILVIDRNTVTFKRGLLLIPGWTMISADYNEVQHIKIDSRMESSGNEEGPSILTTYYDIHVIPKTGKKFRLIKGLKEKEANFLLKQLTKYKDRYINSINNKTKGHN